VRHFLPKEADDVRRTTDVRPLTDHHCFFLLLLFSALVVGRLVPVLVLASCSIAITIVISLLLASHQNKAPNLLTTFRHIAQIDI
jgi:hypothetical protein